MPPWFIHPISSSLLPCLAPTFWICTRKLEETPCARRCCAAGFLVLVYLLLLLCWTGARMTFVHRMCVIPQRSYSCGASLLRLVWLHDLEVSFFSLHRQCSCGNIPVHLVFKGMNTTATPLPFNYIDRSWERFDFCYEPQQRMPKSYPWFQAKV
jgi:hypothetical protein